ncbi:HDIG domain-containing metalloprotein [Clostridium sp. DJ247]|uniref:HDIG domain-containing metalloprotein n=1 Tax=Clostridium sp. DJ247 TaxID=2726188 RepID=UPI0016268998|nr:HDIG domain-containing metalloprotein [Clostridium sp. DJ247]MBC2582392.1 HDIG domain-containing protein [Clostridium sp. DJ247]
MNFYRIKQFFWSINSKVSDSDIKFINRNLSKEELNLFYKLSNAEQKHSIRVAQDVEDVCKKHSISSSLLIKAALLHDIGKTMANLSIFDKSILVILDKITKGSIKKFSGISKVKVYYDHAKIGANILRKYNYDLKLIYLIENHHNVNINDNKELNILRICDNKN